MSKNLNTIQKIAKAGRIISKIIFIFSIIGAVASFIGVSALWGLHKVELDGVEVVNIIEEAGAPFVTTMFSACISILYCISSAVIFKFAEIYFSNELEVGTPFTYDGAKELLRLGLIGLILPLCISAISSIAFTVTKLFWPILEPDALIESPSIGIALIVIIISFILKYGADLEEKAQSYSEQTQSTNTDNVNID